MSDLSARGLSQQDAFFVAYQEESSICMHVGVELELSGALSRADLEAVAGRLVERWPQLGQTLHRRLLGLAWQGPPQVDAMVVKDADGPPLERWRNTMLDPFCEPPLQLRWIPHTGGGTLALRAHHAALDGQAMMSVAQFILRILAGGGSSRELPSHSRPGARKQEGLWRHFRRGHLGPRWGYLRWLKRESKLDRSVRLKVRQTAPGDVAVYTRRIEGVARVRLLERTRSLGVQLPWLFCAAWIRTIGAWNAAHGGGKGQVSLEVPVSTRRSRLPGGQELGNGISPLVLAADAEQPLADIARSLRVQFVDGIRRRAHLAVPLFTAGGGYLPWWLFRRLATDTAFSGFATSHFTWMRTPEDPRTLLDELSEGRLKLLRYEVYGPVCLHMGAAVFVIESPEGLKLSMPHRLNAISAADADRLGTLLMAELLPEQLPQREDRSA